MDFSSLKKRLNFGRAIDLEVKVSAGSAGNYLKGVMADGSWKIFLSTAPERGKANQSLIKFIKDNLRPVKVDVKIVRGQRSPTKMLKIEKIR